MKIYIGHTGYFCLNFDPRLLSYHRDDWGANGWDVEITFFFININFGVDK